MRKVKKFEIGKSYKSLNPYYKPMKVVGVEDVSDVTNTYRIIYIENREHFAPFRPLLFTEIRNGVEVVTIRNKVVHSADQEL